MEELLKSISGTICNYRDGEFGHLDEEHVRKWVNQFDEPDRVIVLEETNRILRRTYFSKQNFFDFIDGLIKSTKFASEDQCSFWGNVSLLKIQQNGRSQSELLELAASIIESNFGFTPKINSDSDHYVYIDDYLFSGNRLVNDLRNWINSDAPGRCDVSIVFMGWFQGGIWYAQNKLTELAKQAKKDIRFKYWSHEDLRLENRLFKKNESHVFWPVQEISDDEAVKRYLETQAKEPVYREENGFKNKIFSVERRTQYENALLKAGIKILGFCNSPSPVVKPLGYSRFDGFGFGSTVFSFRNCPNNNPLAFWWGDPTYLPSHPFGKWYPLLQRKTYGE
ncbi:hypothetical protein OQJ46_11860 [Microbulbifer thermotolerans]|uniref:phosphoribosyltransferase-like protein n=1 Tax=Microbulbifer thermotolerans TaxID=252514 RepID=UPI00224AC7C7|nr:hypothetical protein [Microbulbifer thermotolerans]MCX2780604.1 hypothetical protein [Microbulbifer thermotolerans]MCX2783681.1 hypothetical protein [Microbulbifer thermotolerans]MCX2806145.1 hypothetical protein [Microbulbifer thermotolerans]